MNYKIKEISEIVNGSTPSTSNSEYWDGDITWLTPKDLTNFTSRYIYEGHASITLKGYSSCSTKLVPEGTILLSSRAPIGYLAIAGKELCTNQGFKSIICNQEIVNNIYLYYWLSTRIDYLQSISNGATFKELSKETLENVEIDLPTITEQQHIVDTIGSIDDLIENYQLQIQSLFKYGLVLINEKNENNELINLSTIAKLEKGIEVGSGIYLDQKTEKSIKYLRVADLLSEGVTYIPIEESKNKAYEEDILIAFDGAPGRNAIGLSGSFSSGIYKIICDSASKGLVYFELNSKNNQKIISDYSQGTTILHASKAIPHLVSALIDNEEMLELNFIFKRLVYLKAMVKKLQSNKELLLDKYFTNQQ